MGILWDLIIVVESWSYWSSFNRKKPLTYLIIFVESWSGSWSLYFVTSMWMTTTTHEDKDGAVSWSAERSMCSLDPLEDIMGSAAKDVQTAGRDRLVLCWTKNKPQAIVAPSFWTMNYGEATHIYPASLLMCDKCDFLWDTSSACKPSTPVKPSNSMFGYASQFFADCEPYPFLFLAHEDF